MISNEKLKEIRKRMKSGEPAGELEETLRKEGYSQEDISKIFASKPYDMRSWSHLEHVDQVCPTDCTGI